MPVMLYLNYVEIGQKKKRGTHAIKYVFSLNIEGAIDAP
jgi:hypothetical protein